MFDTMSIIPITAIIMIFILFLTYYWINLNETMETIEKQDVMISAFNSFYFSNQKYGKIKIKSHYLDFNFNHCDKNFMFPVYTNKICGVKISGGNL